MRRVCGLGCDLRWEEKPETRERAVLFEAVK